MWAQEVLDWDGVNPPVCNPATPMAQCKAPSDTMWYVTGVRCSAANAWGDRAKMLLLAFMLCSAHHVQHPQASTCLPWSNTQAKGASQGEGLPLAPGGTAYVH